MYNWFLPPLSSFNSQQETISGWLTRLRWFSLSIQTIIFFMAIKMALLVGVKILAFGLTLVTLGAWNLYLWQKSQGKLGSKFIKIEIQLAVDMLELAVLLALVGGGANPFFNLIFFHAALASLLVRGPLEKWLVAELCVLVIGLHLLAPHGLGYMNLGLLSNRWLFLLARLITLLVIWQLLRSFSQVYLTMQHTIQRAKEQKLRLDRLRAIGALAAGFSHEFSTPLTTAKMRLARFKKNAAATVNDLSDLQVIEQSLVKCEMSLKRLHVIRADAAAFNSTLQPLEQVLRQGVNLWQKENLERNVQIFFAPVSPCLVPEVPFIQLILDMLDNADRASKAGLAMQVHLVVNDHESVVLFIDHGEGFPAHIKEHLGEPFISTFIDGSGLGLYHACSLIQILNGQLELNDTEGGGGTVKISLPHPTQNSHFYQTIHSA